MNGLGILGMFFVGVMLCRHNVAKCPCCHAHGHDYMAGECEVESKPKTKATTKTQTKKEAVKKYVDMYLSSNDVSSFMDQIKQIT